MLDQKQIAIAVAFNAKASDVIWRVADLPPNFRCGGAPPNSVAFALMVAIYQECEGIQADGILGPDTFALMQMTHTLDPQGSVAPSGDLYIDAVLHFAFSKVGVREDGCHPRSDVAIFLDAAGGRLQDGSVWGQAFAYWAYTTGAGWLGLETTAPKAVSAAHAWNLAKQSGSTVITASEIREGATVLAGDQVFRVRNGHLDDIKAISNGCLPTCYTAIIERRVGSILYTIEGNVNQSGSHEGSGVYRRSYSLQSDTLLGVVRHTASGG